MRAWYGRTLFSGYLDVDSELRREASCLRGGSWVSNVSRGEMFEGIVAPTFLGWDQHGLRCLLFGVSSKFEGTHASPQNHLEHGMDGHCFRGGSIGRSLRSSKVVQWMHAHWFVLSCHPGCLPCTFSSLSFYAARNMGRCGSISPSLEFAVSNLSPAGDRVPLGSGGALREGLKTTSGGRLAGGASV